jgi:hypothetical protein
MKPTPVIVTVPASAAGGGWVVFEVWESRAAQERFLNERLRPVLEAAGVTTPPTRVEWLDVAAYASPGS